MSLTGSSVLVLGGGCLGIPILAPTALEREKSSDRPMGWSRVVGLVGSEVAAAAGRAMTMHSTGRGEVAAAVIASSRRRPAHQARHVHQHHPLGRPPSSPPSTVQSIPMADPAAAKGGMMGGDVQRRSGSQRTEGGGGASALTHSSYISHNF